MALFGKQQQDSKAAKSGVDGPVAALETPPAASAAAARADPSKRPDDRKSRSSGGSQKQGSEVANIGKSISIKGDLPGNEDIVIEGKVEGKVDLPNNQLTIGGDGSVNAEISAKSVVIIGRVKGNVDGTERIEIQATGIVEGDVSAPRLVVAEGAVVNGSVAMTKPGQSQTAKPLQEKPTAATG